MSLDTSKHVCVGATKERLRGKVAGHAEYRCDGCGKQIYIVTRMLNAARKIADRDDTTICIVCMKCADPWLKKIATDGGHVKGQQHVIEQDVVPTIMRHRGDQIRSN